MYDENSSFPSTLFRCCVEVAQTCKCIRLVATRWKSLWFEWRSMTKAIDSLDLASGFLATILGC